jgi:hypothetical protein
MDRILKIGFKNVGFWQRHNRNPDWIFFESRTVAPHPHTLYAFVIDGDVMYVGKTSKTLKGRMGNYMRAATQQAKDSTNARNARNILSALRAGQTVDIYALPDEELHHYGAFHLNLAAALEDSIIAVLNPEWNGGKKLVVDDVEDVDPDVVFAPVQLPQRTPEPTPLPLPLPRATQAFFVKMGATYFEKGFFNIGVDGGGSLGEDGETIELYLGNMATPALGTINRRANLNGTPRIFGGKRLRQWVQETMKQDDTMTVEVLTPTAIRLSLETES